MKRQILTSLALLSFCICGYAQDQSTEPFKMSDCRSLTSARGVTDLVGMKFKFKLGKVLKNYGKATTLHHSTTSNYDSDNAQGVVNTLITRKLTEPVVDPLVRFSSEDEFTVRGFDFELGQSYAIIFESNTTKNRYQFSLSGIPNEITENHATIEALVGAFMLSTSTENIEQDYRYTQQAKRDFEPQFIQKDWVKCGEYLFNEIPVNFLENTEGTLPQSVEI